MEIETPLPPVLISSNQPAAMEVDDITASPPSNPVEQAPVTRPRPTLADKLKGHEEILKKAAFKVEMRKPLAADLRAIEQLFEAGRPTWEVLSARLEAAQPFQIPREKFSVVLETGQALVRTSLSQTLQSLVRDHGNKSLAERFAPKKRWSNFKNTWW
uniref:AlNc14C30G2849 protein n=1 Tax=Albugo laibachii Nc14 TaxID=890382 RepID=F0W7P5_9STRA|nr:AlNc14C30G2849 [Albugo laibachii Nc14]|eukprot:CCA17146.1 AlNc14C30G2849 [Albugo laibachii Nc14]